MWAQLIRARLKPGREDDLPKLVDLLRATEQPGSGLVRSIASQDQTDPRAVLMFVLFESEAAARAREADERRQEGLQVARALMADMFDGPPSFTDLNVVADFIP
jgi:hypothetical protein